MFQYPADLLSKINDKIRNSDAKNVIYIRNLMKNNFINKFAPVKCFDGTKEAELAKDLLVVSKNIYDKYEGNAFSNKELISFLQSNDVDEVEVIGVDGGGCVSLTAIGAIENGYKTVLNTDLIGTMFEKQKTKYYEKLQQLGAVFI